MKNHQTTSQHEQGQLEEHGEGKSESETFPDPKTDHKTDRGKDDRGRTEGSTSTSNRPDVVYKDIEIDLDFLEWIVVGIILIIITSIYLR